jgi:hypothetical protein
VPQALETINTYGTGNGSLTTLAHVADPSQSLAIRSSNGLPSAYLFGIWAMMGAAADLSIFSPRMHDDVHGIQLRVQASKSDPLFDYAQDQAMYSQDTPTVQSVFGSAPSNAVAEQAGYNIYYDDLPGISANLMSWAQVESQIISFYGVKVSCTSSATPGALGAGSAINSVYDNFKANQRYALLGYQVSAECGNVSVQGSDTGNLQIGGPGSIAPIETRRYFIDISNASGRSCIPVINSANKASTNVFVSHTTASTTIIVDLLFAYLGP